MGKYTSRKRCEDMSLAGSPTLGRYPVSRYDAGHDMRDKVKKDYLLRRSRYLPLFFKELF